MANLPPIPASLKPIAHFLKTAQEHGKQIDFNIFPIVLFH